MSHQAAKRERKLELLELLEEKRRRHAREDLNEYCKYIQIPGVPMHDAGVFDEPDAMVTENGVTAPLGIYPDCEQFYADNVTPAAHHELINHTLMRVEKGELRRVIFLLPPGSAKSTYATVAFPTWFMGKRRGRQVISASYGADLATRFGRKCRHIVDSREYREVFGTCMKAGNRAAADWSLENESSYMSRGLLGGITGNRADGIVIDDPIKGREEADSPTIRDKIWQEYLASVRTRLKPRGFIVLIQTRWHGDDLAGRILPANWAGESGWVKAKDGEMWWVVCLPAQCEREGDPLGRQPGEWLWTDWFPVEHWEQEKITQGSRNWAALYQQRPSLDDGGVWVLKWFKRHGVAPDERSNHALVIQSWDTGIKPAQINDPSVCTTWLVTPTMIYLLHVWRKQVNFPDLKRAAINLAVQWKPDWIAVEDKASGQSLIQELREMPAIEVTDARGKKRSLVLSIIAVEPEGDKIARAQAVAPMIEAGRVSLPEVADWLVDYETEISAFPVAPHDDQVDSSSQGLDQIRKRVFFGERVASSEQQRVGFDTDGPTTAGGTDFGNMLGSDTSGFL